MALYAYEIMSMKMVSANTLKIGSYLVVEDAACQVMSIQISRPGKHGHAKSRIEAVGLIDKKKRITVMPSHDTVSVPMIEKRVAQILSFNDTVANVMDAESYETFDLKVPEAFKREFERRHRSFILGYSKRQSDETVER